jgi:hypothetical protein
VSKNKFGFILLLVILFSVLLAVRPANAHKNHDNQNQCNIYNLQNCPLPSQICDKGEAIGNPHCSPSEEPTVTMLPTDEAASPTASVEATATPQPNTGDPGDGLSDGKSDGKSSCPSCTEAPKTFIVPNFAPNTGRAN